jgi:hypothetical protein
VSSPPPASSATATSARLVCSLRKVSLEDIPQRFPRALLTRESDGRPAVIVAIKNRARLVYELIATSLATVFMFRAVPEFAAGICSLDLPIPDG